MLLLQPVVLVLAVLPFLVSVAATTGCGATKEPELTTASAPATPEVGKLAFRRLTQGEPATSAEIWIANAGGSNATRVTCNNRLDFAAAWSPNGETIAFYSQQTVSGVPTQFLYLIEVSGGCGPGQLVAEGRFPRWSPDGLKLVFDRGRLGVRDIFVRDLASGAEVNLTNDAAARNLRADWSPDGTDRIVFARGINVDGVEDAEDIYVMSADGSGRTQLTFDALTTCQDRLSDTRFSCGDNGPKWSPDGKRIVFQSDRDGDPGFDEIYVMSADGTGQTRLTDLAGGAVNPDWSPNGKRIVFQYCVNGDRAPCAVQQLYSMNADGTDLRPASTALHVSPDPLDTRAIFNGFPDWVGGHVEPAGADED